MTDFISPVGRMVAGHPMNRTVVTDDNNVPQLDSLGNKRTQAYVGMAIPKGTETHWNQTEWGQQIYNQAKADWPNGEYQSPTFAWKITDGDSQIPNKVGKRPCDKEGYPGHWVLNVSTELAFPCYHKDRYQPYQAIQDAKEIKCGDYIRLVIGVKGNAPSKSPGVYLNPRSFELYQSGIAIMGSSDPDPMATFGATPGQLPAGAAIDPNVPPVQQQQPAVPVQQQPAVPVQQSVVPVQQTAPPVQQQAPAVPVVPNTAFVANAAAPQRVLTEKAMGQTYETLIAQGWTDALLVQHGLMLP